MYWILKKGIIYKAALRELTLEQRRVIVANEGRAPRTGLGYTNRECLKMGGDHLKSLLLL